MPFLFRDRRAGRVETLNDYTAFGDDVDFDVDEAQANVVTSRMNDTWMVGSSIEWHYPVLDLDFSVIAEPSTTEGHHHLYLDRLMPWADVVKLLDVLVEVGLVEPGYAEAAKIRGYTSVRLPWVKKPPREEAAS